MQFSPFVRPGWRSAFWSFLFAAPAVFLAAPGLVQSLTGSDALYGFLRRSLTFPAFSAWDLLIHPAVVIIGLFAALLISLFSVLALSIKNEDSKLVTVLALEKSIWNLTPLVLALFLGLIIFLYLIAENFGALF